MLIKQINHYLPFFILTALLYGVFFHFHKQSAIIPPLPLNSGQQTLQLQVIEIAQKPEKTAPSEPTTKKSEAVEDKPQTTEKKKNETVKEKPQPTVKKKTEKQLTAESNAKIKIARQKLHKAIKQTAAINDAMLKAELFSADYKQKALTSEIAAKTVEKTAAKEPPIKSKPVKTMHPIKEAQKPEIAPQQEKSKPVVKKQPPADSAQTQGVLQEAIVVSGNTPNYPTRAILRNQQGRVVVKLTVTTKGKGKNPQIITSSGYSILDNAILDFIQKELFMPAHHGEEKITSEQVFSFRFQLK